QSVRLLAGRPLQPAASQGPSSAAAPGPGGRAPGSWGRGAGRAAGPGGNRSDGWPGAVRAEGLQEAPYPDPPLRRRQDTRGPQGIAPGRDVGVLRVRPGPRLPTAGRPPAPHRPSPPTRADVPNVRTDRRGTASPGGAYDAGRAALREQPAAALWSRPHRAVEEPQGALSADQARRSGAPGQSFDPGRRPEAPRRFGAVAPARPE